MRIALVVHDYHQGCGHGRYVAELARRFSRAHEVHVFANRHSESPDWPIHFHHVPALRVTALASVLSFILPATAVVGRGFDVVHAQGACLLGCDVMTAHICQRAWHRARLAAEGRLRWKDHLFAGIVSPLEEALMSGRRSPWIIAVSERLRRDLREQYGRADRVSVIHHGVALERFSPAERARRRQAARAQIGLRSGDVAFLFVGDLRKGAEPALRALARVPAGVLLTVSRTPPERYRALASSLGISDRLNICPPTAEIEAYYAAADALLFPTPYDAFGMVISEAMASGLAVITSREAGAAELIEHQRTGILLASAYDPDEIAQHIELVARDDAYRQEIGQAAARSMEAHGWDQVAARTLAVYEAARLEH